jgi:hypothetical protein
VVAVFKRSADFESDPDDEITEKRARVTLPVRAETRLSLRPTARMSRVDARLIAIARGELAPDEIDPFGGLIPIYDEEPSREVADDWLVLEPPEQDPGPGSSDLIFAQVKPTLSVPRDEARVLPVAERTALFLAQIDGLRTVQELVAVCQFDDLEALEIIDELLRMGVIDLR